MSEDRPPYGKPRRRGKIKVYRELGVYVFEIRGPNGRLIAVSHAYQDRNDCYAGLLIAARALGRVSV